jgi:hypothetical protein
MTAAIIEKGNNDTDRRFLTRRQITRRKIGRKERSQVVLAEKKPPSNHVRPPPKRKNPARLNFSSTQPSSPPNSPQPKSPKMPKRKRTSPSDPQSAIREKLVQSKKLLQRALKTAKGFERQKLGKRLKNAQTNGTDVSRINREIEALKTLELGEVAEGYLYGRIGKIKRFVESPLLPEEVLGGKKEKEGQSEEEISAVRNVTSGMFNMGCVKVVLEEVLRGLYLDMGIPVPEDVKKGKKVKKQEEKAPKGILKSQKTAEPIEQGGESAWDGFESGAEEDEEMDGQDEDLDSEDLSRYDALLGSDSDSDSNPSDDEDDGIQRPSTKPSKPTKQQSLSLSPSPSPSPPPPTKRPKTKPPAAAPKSTVLLPTLLGGFFSGSDDSSASDIDDPAPAPIRKNRPGQMARRAIWEKKFGAGANHVKSGAPRVAEMGKKGREEAKGKERGRGGGGFGSGRERPSRGTGENATEVGGKKRGMGRKDDAGPLHPSWQAAKAAKEAKKSVAFQGKKVTFD